MRNQNQQFSKRAGEQPNPDRLADLFAQLCALIDADHGLSSSVIQFFTLLAQRDWKSCIEILARVQRQNAVMAKAIIAQTGISDVTVRGKWVIAVHNQHYIALHRTSKVVLDITNFAVRIGCGTWFEQERETWLSGTIEMGERIYPIMFKHSDLDRATTFTSACNYAVYGALGEERMAQPVITYPEHTAGLLQLLRQQAQDVHIRRGLSKLGWDKQRSCFIAPAWFADTKGVHATTAPAHPANETFQTHYTTVQFKETAEPKIAGTAGSLLAALVALLRRSYHKWPCLRIDLQHTRAAEQLLQAIFAPLNQITAVTGNWKQMEKILFGYPIFSTATANIPEDYPAFNLGKSGLVIPEMDSSSVNLANISAAGAHVIKSCLPFIIKEVASPPIADEQDFFKLAHEGRDIIAACSDVVRINSGRGQTLWRYFSEIPVADLVNKVVLDMSQQYVYFYFRHSSIKRKALRDELIREYPGTEASMFGDHYIQLKALDGLEILQQFYGGNLPIARRTMVENSEVGTDSGVVSSLKPSI